MCGITGIYNFRSKKTVFAEDIRIMNEAIKHRGPAGEGVWVNKNIGLGHRRLKIIDLSDAARQPLCNEDGNLQLVFNGEIYNFLELRERLEKYGHKFKSGSDAEVILHLYEEYGTQFAEKLSGMFALAIWDSLKQRLIMARDRMGMKPLFYYQYESGIIFASEIKSILVNPAYKKEINFEALHYYFFYNQVPGPKTFFKNIYSVEPANLLILEANRRLKKNKYWRLTFKPIITDENEAAEMLINALESSVRSHMRLDVPFAVGLSGGIDSSILVALLTKYSSKPVKTFSLSFTRDLLLKKKEFQMTESIARLFKTDHNSVVLGPQSVLDNLETIVNALDVPICTFALTYYLCKEASKNSKVLFTGDGSEELFGKYWNHRLAQNISYFLSFIYDTREKRYYEKIFINQYSKISAERSFQFSMLFSFRENDRKLLYSKSLFQRIRKYDVSGSIKNMFQETNRGNFLNMVLSIDTRNFLVNHALTVIDRSSMINSIETRHPFLDYKIVELIATFSPYLKFKRGLTKYILKKSVKNMIPNNLIDHFYSGVTGPPISKWLLFELEGYVRNVLSPTNLEKHGFFNINYVQSILDEHYNLKYVHEKHNDYMFSLPEKNHTIKIWKLLIFQLWWQNHFL
jgi:asparagine synthase (glutamine-hydrolysing)